MTQKSDPSTASYYRRLGVAESADGGVISDAAREVQKRYHPDHNDHPDNQRQFRRVRTACECLTDENDRAAYDVFLERFGRETATEVYEQWDADGRHSTPEVFSSVAASRHGETGRTDAAERSDDRDRQSSSESKPEGDAARSETGATETRGTASSDGTPGNATSDPSAGHRTHRNFGHRQEYERASYSPSGSGQVVDWLRVEVGLLAREMSGVVSVGVIAGAGLVLSLLAALVVVLASYPVGLLLAAFEFVLRSLGVLQFDAFFVSELILTIALEFAIYGGAVFAGSVVFEVLYDRSWDDHLGNRLSLPRRVLLVPVGTAVAAHAFWFSGSITSLDAARKTLVAGAGEVASFAVLTAVAWQFLHRSALVLRETPPNDGRESLLDTVSWMLFQVGFGSLLLGAYVFGWTRLLGGVDQGFEYTLFLRFLSTPLLVTVAFVTCAVAATLAACLSLYGIAGRTAVGRADDRGQP